MVMITYPASPARPAVRLSLNPANAPRKVPTQARSKAERNQMVEDNVKLAYAEASRWAARYKGKMGNAIDVEDLKQAGVIGLMRAAELYDSRTGNAFSTYATGWIRQQIRRCISQSRHMIRIPSHIQEGKAIAIYRVSERLENELGREPNTAEIAARTGLPLATVDLVRFVCRLDVLSLDQSLGMGGSSGNHGDYSTVAEMVGRCADSSMRSSVVAEGPEAATVLADLIARALAEADMSAMERHILGVRHGIRAAATQDSGEGRHRHGRGAAADTVFDVIQGIDADGCDTLRAIADAVGLSRERVRQIGESALAKLRATPTMQAMAKEWGVHVDAPGCSTLVH